jgi:Tol biopolymer transport system component
MTLIQPVAWSPDGDQIAVIIRRNNLLSLGLAAVKDGSLKTVAEDLGSITRAFFSPDGKYLAVDVPRKGSAEREIYLMAVDGTGRVPIASAEDNRVMGWRNDGVLLFTRRHAYASLWALRVVNGRPQGDPVRLSDRVGEIPAGVTSDGRLFYADTKGGQKVYIAPANFATERIDAAESLIDVNGSRPEWSPDGRYLSYRAANVLIIWNVATGERRKFGGVGGGNVRWSPDSRHVVFIRQRDRFELVILDSLENTEEIVATYSVTPAVIAFPCWSADGKDIYFQRRNQDKGGDVEFVAFNLASRKERVLIRRPDLSSLHLSPDGKYIATSRAGAGILLVPTDGRDPKPIAAANSGESMYFTGWAPDSKTAYFWSRIGEQPRVIWRVDVDGSNPRSVNFGINMDRISGPIFLPNREGSKVAYFTDEGPVVLELRVVDTNSIR